MAVFTLYRDEPVEFIARLETDYYECVHCRDRILTRNDEALEEFIAMHEECEKEKKND